MNIIRRWLRRKLRPPEACPYIKCREPMELEATVVDGDYLVGTWRCTGPDRHKWTLDHKPKGET